MTVSLCFFAGCVQTVAIIGPIFGFLLGSLCAKLYVDIGFVDLGKSEKSFLKIVYSMCCIEKFQILQSKWYGGYKKAG